MDKVLLTAPADDVSNIVYGVNHKTLNSEQNIVSAASCTTNAIVTVLKLMNENFGIVSGHIETVHSYTNDQNLTDNLHAKPRRGRAAGTNIVVTSTGAQKAINAILPGLGDKLTANAIRVPTPNVSLAVMSLEVSKPLERTQILEFLRNSATNSRYSQVLDYADSSEMVSSDFIGSKFAAVIDANATLVKENRCVLYIWYDNEYGYSTQLMRLLRWMSGQHIKLVPKWRSS